jgi:allantoicase
MTLADAVLPDSPAGPQLPDLSASDPTVFPDLASRTLRGSVLAASDEFFAEKENLIKAEVPTFAPKTFGHKGQVYDGWETRRRHSPDGDLPGSEGGDWAVVRLGAPAVVRGVVVDTAFFTGNYPPACSVDACAVTGYQAVGELTALPAGPAAPEGAWEEIVPRSPLLGDRQHLFEVRSPRRYTHVRLNIFPDGGVARLRVHGEVVPDPGLLCGLSIDLAALENGADVVDCNDRFYSSPRNVISPGLSRVMGEGWETRRRRGKGNDWLIVRLAGAGIVQLAEIDTSGYIGNAPGAASLLGIDATKAQLSDEGAWFELLPRTRLLPDTAHRFRLDSNVDVNMDSAVNVDSGGTGAGSTVTHVRLDIFPDGGVARLRLYGSLSPAGLAGLERRWDATG